MPMDRSLYVPGWNETAKRLKREVGYRCQKCGIAHGATALNRFNQPYKVVLTVAHLDHNPSEPDARLAVLCQACHCRYDQSKEQRGRKAASMSKARGQLPLFPG